MYCRWLYLLPFFFSQCIYSGMGHDGSTEFSSMIMYHNNSPRWNERLKVAIPIDQFAGAHLRLEYRHCSSMFIHIQCTWFKYFFACLTHFSIPFCIFEVFEFNQSVKLNWLCIILLYNFIPGHWYGVFVLILNVLKYNWIGVWKIIMYFV